MDFGRFTSIFGMFFLSTPAGLNSRDEGLSRGRGRSSIPEGPPSPSGRWQALSHNVRADKSRENMVKSYQNSPNTSRKAAKSL